MPKGIRRTIKKFRKPPPLHEGELLDADFSHLQERVKLARQRFCQEYIKDYNGANAMRRLGSESKTPWVRASEFLKEPYTQYYLRQLIETAEEKSIVSRNEVLHILKREAHYFDPIDGSTASRISAARSLAKILGMEVTKVEGNMSLNGGVMLVPLAQSQAEWEASSKKSQSELKKAVRQ